VWGLEVGADIYIIQGEPPTCTPIASDHITNDLDWLVVHKHYHCIKQVQVDNDVGLQILHTCRFTIDIVSCPLIFCNILHLSDIAKHISVHNFLGDINVYFEFYLCLFSIKDSLTWISLLEGHYDGGMYSLKQYDGATLKQTLIG
jgi:hypothetical protein